MRDATKGTSATSGCSGVDRRNHAWLSISMLSGVCAVTSPSSFSLDLFCIQGSARSHICTATNSATVRPSQAAAAPSYCLFGEDYVPGQAVPWGQ